MKKILSIIIAAALAVPMFAADKLTPEERANADYSAWLPQAGDFQVGFSLDPIATFGNIIFNGGAGNNNVGLDASVGGDFAGEGLLTNQASIMGSYMLTDQLSVKANIGLNIVDRSRKGYVLDDAALFMNPMSRAKVTDKVRYQRYGGSISAGIEYRVGKKLPVQGVFGVGLVYAFALNNQKTYSYGNGITKDNQNPSMTSALIDEAAGAYVAPSTVAVADMPNARPTKVAAEGMWHALGLYGSIGAEWFVAPKIALGANVNLIVDYSWSPSIYTEYEGWSPVTNQLRQNFIELEDGPVRESGFEFSTRNIGANLYVAFYF